MTPIDGDTIVARATARGIAAIAMIRLSGSDALDIAQNCFSGTDLSAKESHTAHVGFMQSVSKKDLDQVVVTIFRAPKTVTGENVVEITCHGGELVSHRILDALILAGARPAEPGEFTQRAFLNGKMDLAQAEAVSELIHSGSRRAHTISLAHLKGSYSVLLHDLREEMLDMCGFIELELDFAEEDVEFADKARLSDLLERTKALLKRLIESYRYGAVVRDGIRIVLAGRPNAGKSTLLNALVGYDRAIVSEIPGTTRDEIGEEAEYEGIRLRFMDTAGLRKSGDEIESEGVRRAEASIRKADVLMYVYDATIGLEEEEREFLDDLKQNESDLHIFVVRNKCDLLDGEIAVDGEHSLSALRAMNDESLVIPLLSDIVKSVEEDDSYGEGSYVVTNERHRYHLGEAYEAIVSAMNGLNADMTGEVIALDLRLAMKELGAITGATATEEILDRIFSRFCIGK
ncbi:MAG: tRNA uridine-5-carboxymethylaminomethyl(34) synthesis GTPase MnmE [Bacteroidetes bacterium]|nr:tRNA uridine-5-carboxymethylaminomethyl(34) synthesis GTPase MnmE [Bacteroidota bacterium]